MVPLGAGLVVAPESTELMLADVKAVPEVPVAGAVTVVVVETAAVVPEKEAFVTLSQLSRTASTL